MTKILCMMVLMLIISACDDSDTLKKVDKEHVWKQQTDMIDKAKNVEQLLNDAAIQRQKTIEQQVNQ
ncbi:MAG TPA: hypothetical protein ENH74_11715 [Methylophaga sp.]|nr:hypothetical protein [Methylophaga sp.]HEC60376.1 hypothetical protein [Methylophaga sp.]